MIGIIVGVVVGVGGVIVFTAVIVILMIFCVKPRIRKGRPQSNVRLKRD